MEFKFDTKTTYTVITPMADVLDMDLTVKLAEKVKLAGDDKPGNFIIDLQECKKADNKSFAEIADLHDWCYENQHSLVFTGIQPDILQMMQEEELTESLNIAPTMVEAADIISMEVLERDLMAEEDGEWNDEI